MSISLEEIYNHTKERYQLKLLTGTNGLTREFTWVQLCEDIGNCDFFRGHELVISTGLASMQENWLQDFITELFRHRVCGLILNTGKYIRPADIPPEIIDFCKEKHFPLFTMPWKIHIADIMQDYCSRLLHAQEQESRLENLLAGLLSGGSQGEKCQQELTARGLLNLPFQLVVFPLTAAQLSHDQEQLIRLTCKRRLNHFTSFYSILCHARQILLVFGQPPADIHNCIIELSQDLPADCLSGHIGLSQLYDNLADLPTALKEARAAAATARLQQTALLSFSELGPYRLLFMSEQHSLLQQMHREKLQPLIDYDAAHQSQLLPTLRAYLFHNSSLQETARLTFTHRNTIGYRLRKIKELLGCDLDDSEVRFSYMLAFYIADYLQLTAADCP